MSDTWRVEARFRGPPGSGNGGYCAGVMGERLGGDAVVRLNAPIPLEEPLRFEKEEHPDGLCERLLRVEDGSLLAEARPARLTDEALPLDGADLHRLASAQPRKPGGDYAHCFGCGEERQPDDAIRVLGRQLPDSGLSGCVWRPHESFAGPEGFLAPRYVWTALDCTAGLAALHLDPRPVLTGTMQVRLDGPVRAGEDHAVLAWPIEKDGRKITTGSALYDLDGTVKAVARLIWIVLK